MKKLLLVFLFFTGITLAQNFSVDEYTNFLQSHRNMLPSELLNMYEAGIFQEEYDFNFDGVLYYDSIAQKYNLTDDEKALITANGFMVSERLKKETFGQQYIDIYHKDLPVFVSTDAILHAFHRSYDVILSQIEAYWLNDQLTTILMEMHGEVEQLSTLYAGYPTLKRSLLDVDLYLTIPLRLLGKNIDPVFEENNSELDTILDLIDQEGVVEYPLFADYARKIDFSQFKPRGHYVSDMFPELADYFRAMIWLGRTELYLTPPTGILPPGPSFSDIRRQILDAYFITQLVEDADVSELLDSFEAVLEYFVGEQDNVTTTNFKEVINSVNITSPAQFLDSLKLVEFQESLLTNDFATQKILSQILMNNPMDPEQITPASAFMFLGQRFVVDSYITGGVVFDKIRFNDEEIKRMLPSTLDVIFALGNSAAAQLLQGELEEYKYSTNLAALRYLVDSYDEEHWKSSIYYMWLNAIRKLNPPESREELPLFMQSAAWWQEKMNTQLASWTELRHDNLLYAKQSYTGGTICSYPYSFVEPNPEFFNWMSTLSQEVSTRFTEFAGGDFQFSSAINYFNYLGAVCDTLSSIASKELNAIQLDEAEKQFLHTMLYESVSGYNSPPYTGWYPKLFFTYWSADFAPFTTQDYIVADYHTAPTDESGAPIGWVAHAGTGPIDLAVVVADDPSGEQIAFVGPVSSYYEYTSTNFFRVNDDEWREEYLALSARPSWVNVYLADESGTKMSAGPHLITSLNQEESGLIPETEILVGNYPNPFNPSTYISFTIPFDLTNQKVKLNIYDITGELVTTLINKDLPAGTYVTKWDGINSAGVQVSSGVYIYEVRAGDKLKAGKMNLVK